MTYHGHQTLVPSLQQSVSGMFTEKELQVIRLICAQASNQEIAVRLEKAVRTIEGYRSKIFDKMKVKNTAGMVIYAVKAGIYKIK